jgi:hypothetical protein
MKDLIRASIADPLSALVGENDFKDFCNSYDGKPAKKRKCAENSEN